MAICIPLRHKLLVPPSGGAIRIDYYAQAAAGMRKDVEGEEALERT